MYPVEVLNKIKWTGNPFFIGVKIIYISRGEANDEASASESEIKEIGKSQFIVQRQDKPYPTIIPYHRIKSILLNGLEIWNIKNPKDVRV